MGFVDGLELSMGMRLKIILSILALLSIPVHADDVRVLAFGDSLTAGYGLPEEDGFVPVLEKELRGKGLAVTVLQAGISGDTTSDAVSRLEWSLKENPDIVILAFGGNDILRMLDPAIIRDNLDKIIVELKSRDIEVLLAGMKSPPNFGPDYQEKISVLYQDLAVKHSVELYPFFLEGVATLPEMNQSDGKHPNAVGVREIVSRIVPRVEALIISGQ